MMVFGYFWLKYNYNWYMIWYVFLFQIQHNDINMMQPKCLVPDIKPSLFQWIKPLAPRVDSCLSNPRFPGLAYQKGPSARWRHRWVRIWSDSESQIRKGEKKHPRRWFFSDSMNFKLKKFGEGLFMSQCSLFGKSKKTLGNRERKDIFSPGEGVFVQQKWGVKLRALKRHVL